MAESARKKLEEELLSARSEIKGRLSLTTAAFDDQCMENVENSVKLQDARKTVSELHQEIEFLKEELQVRLLISSRCAIGFVVEEG